MKIKIGISACLLGEKVRYDGQHKLDHFLKDTLGQFVEWIPVCPEVECGLSVPREAMRLEGDPAAPRLMTIRTRVDLTEKMHSWTLRRIKELEKEELCGYVFKSKSPSSGMERVKVYNDKGVPRKVGSGLFAKAFMERFPELPAEDEGRMHDPVLRENFIERAFVFSRWKDFAKDAPSVNGLVQFHSKHKLLIMSHSPKILKDLGNIVASAGKSGKPELFDEYLKILMGALKLRATVKKNVNVLQHIAGYFKKLLTPDEKKEVAEIIGNYHKGFAPLIVPVTLLNHYVRKYDQEYLKEQYYLNPHPVELALRNHV
jgi:uncharacterized protein YbgA (DUF1722 family)/uncharacterized protein YbbK (DUF523 family)